MCFVWMYIVLNTLLEYKYFHIWNNITSYTFLLVPKFVESLQCMLNTHICWTKAENITAKMHFVFMFKIDVLTTSREVHPPNSESHFMTFIGSLWDIAAKRKTMKQLSFWCLRHTFGEIRFKIAKWKCICKRGSKLKSWGRPKEFTQ